MRRREFVKGFFFAGVSLPSLSSFYVLKKQRKIRAFLIGDEIRAGYQDFVKKELFAQADITWPEETIINTHDMSDKLDIWLGDTSFDVIHINSGLHDLKIDQISGQNVVPLTQYIKNLGAIIKKIHQLQPNASIVWATTTPVLDERSDREGQAFRYRNADVLSYNEAALMTMGRLGVGLNDVYKLIMESGGPYLLENDGITFREAGNMHLAQWVSYSIKLFAGI
ncbi:MAG: SGNH/GDSL hydrolase family protein [Cyclobacteriaceae bacterium]|nr:SGNH/GDSL hydrolase family protein [Cyclobacteriaceae bacterium]